MYLICACSSRDKSGGINKFGNITTRTETSGVNVIINGGTEIKEPLADAQALGRIARGHPANRTEKEPSEVETKQGES